MPRLPRTQYWGKDILTNSWVDWGQKSVSQNTLYFKKLPPAAGGAADAEAKRAAEEANQLKKFKKKTFTIREARSASIMSSGIDVRPYHYVTVWEALVRATSPTLTRADWKIVY